MRRSMAPPQAESRRYISLPQRILRMRARRIYFTLLSGNGIERGQPRRSRPGVGGFEGMA